MKKLLVNASICTGCKACMMACSGQHYEKYSLELSRIKIIKLEDKGIDKPVTCRQCKNAPCVNACPVNALAKDGETGAILTNQDICIGCGLCVEACPFSAAYLDVNGNVMICDLCGGTPRCVEVCPVNAIEYKDINEIPKKKNRATVEKEAPKISSKWRARQPAEG